MPINDKFQWTNLGNILPIDSGFVQLNYNFHLVNNARNNSVTQCVSLNCHIYFVSEYLILTHAL